MINQVGKDSRSYFKTALHVAARNITILTFVKYLITLDADVKHTKWYRRRTLVKK